MAEVTSTRCSPAQRQAAAKLPAPSLPHTDSLNLKGGRRKAASFLTLGRTSIFAQSNRASAPSPQPSQNGVSSSLGCRTPVPADPAGANLPPLLAPGPRAPLTLSGEVPADEGSVHVLQEDDALLRRHAQQVVEAVVGEAAVAEAEQADAVLQLPGQGCAGRDTNRCHTCSGANAHSWHGAGGTACSCPAASQPPAHPTLPPEAAAPQRRQRAEAAVAQRAILT